MTKGINNPNSGQSFGTGWLRPKPDLRDYTVTNPKIVEIGKALGLKKGVKDLPSSVDLRQWFSPIEDQGQLGSCTANAAVGIIEYFENRAHDKYFNGSRLFVYKVTRNLMRWTGNTGAYLRNTMGAIALCGVPAESYWPYTDWPFTGLSEPYDEQEISRRLASGTPDFDREPPAFVYAMASAYKALTYFCHDPAGANIPRSDALASVKKWLAAGHPSMFGFEIFPSFPRGWNAPGGEIPFPGPEGAADSGHAIVVVGYDDEKKIKNNQFGTETTGALLIRNSWGPNWGDNGYGWLPYQYVLNNLATDFWTLSNMDWIDTNQFGFDF